ncbi:MAG: hypothetical protein NWF00_10610 [Candidatus Bathyarchaeota archaeon]|nr:hypothetical protein [Candidatus Bathyarchaeota archaeon]
MPEEIVTIVKIPLSEIEGSIREKYVLPSKLTEARIDGANLVLSFVQDPEMALEEEKPPVSPASQVPRRTRRLRKKRNRMKTRGWIVVARITNSRGQKCSIYKPFIDALRGKQLSAEEQWKAVEKILRSNKNRPTEDSIRYFLDNTLEYLGGGTEN